MIASHPGNSGTRIATMKKIAAEHVLLIMFSEANHQGLARHSLRQSAVHHKKQAAPPLVSRYNPFISRAIQHGIYFALINLASTYRQAQLQTKQFSGET